MDKYTIRECQDDTTVLHLILLFCFKRDLISAVEHIVIPHVQALLNSHIAAILILSIGPPLIILREYREV